MVKNLNLYKHEYDTRMRQQIIAEDIYRVAHASDKTIGMLSYEDEMKAN